MSDQGRSEWSWDNQSPQPPESAPPASGEGAGNGPAGGNTGSNSSGENAASSPTLFPPPANPPRYGQYDPELAAQQQAQYRSNPPGATPPGGPGMAGGGPAGGNFSGGAGQFGPASPNAFGPGSLAAQGSANIQPGIVPLRPLGIAEILNGVISAIRNAPLLMLGLPLALWVIVAALDTAMIYLVAPDYLSTSFTIGQDAASDEATLGMFLNQTQDMLEVSAVSQVITMTMGIFISAFLVLGLSELVLGRRPSLDEVWTKLRGRLGAVVLSALGVGAIAGLLSGAWLLPLDLGSRFIEQEDFATGGIFVLVSLLIALATLVIMLILVIRFMFFVCALVLEELSIGQALARSWNLSKGSFWRIVGTVVVCALVYGFFTYAVSFVATLIPMILVFSGTSSVGLELASVFLSSIASGFYVAFFGATIGLIYLDLRMRREGLAVVLLRAAQENE